MTGASVSGSFKVSTCTLSGTLTTSSSSSPVTSVARTVNVFPGNGGNLRFDSIVNEGSAFQYDKNSSGSWTNITEDLVVNFPKGTTLRVRATLPVVTDTCDFNLIDQRTGKTIGAYTLTRT